MAAEDDELPAERRELRRRLLRRRHAELQHVVQPRNPRVDLDGQVRVRELNEERRRAEAVAVEPPVLREEEFGVHRASRRGVVAEKSRGFGVVEKSVGATKLDCTAFFRPPPLTASLASLGLKPLGAAKIATMV